MSRGFPSMTALLGLLAVAGFQNRDKLAEMMRGEAGGTGAGAAPQGGQQAGLGGLLGGLAGGLGGGGLGAGLGELLDRFRQNGQGEAADSWVGRGANKDIAPHQLESAIGPDVMANLQQQTGLSREEILARLSRDLPRAVDELTPDGRLPS